MAFALTSDASDLSTFDFSAHSTIDVVVPTVAVADVLYCNVIWNTTATATVSGSVNGALTAGLVVDDLGGGGLKTQQFHKENCGAATNETITATFTGTAPTLCGLYGSAWSGGATASAKDVEDGQPDPAPGTGTDAINTTPQTTTAACLIIGVAWDESNSSTINAGTGFSVDHTDSVGAIVFLHVENKVQGGSGSVEATWTATVGGELYTCSFMAIKPAAGGGGGAGPALQTIQHPLRW